MYCIHCGKEIPNDSVFCTHCGKGQDAERSVQPQSSVFQEQSISPNPSSSNAQDIKPQKPSAPFDQEYFFRMAHNNISLMYTSIIIEKKNPFGKVLMRDDLDVADLVDIEIVKSSPFTVGTVQLFSEQDGVRKQFTATFEPWSKKKVNKLISVLSAHTGIQPKTATAQKQIISKRAFALYVTALLLFVFLLIPTDSDVPSAPVNASDASSVSESTNATEDALSLSDASVGQMTENAAAAQGSEATNKSSANGTNSVNAASSQSASASNSAAATQSADTKSNANSSSSKESVSQRNAVSKAKSYINYSAFSREGLIAQLEYEKFTHEQAVYGVNAVGL